MLIGLCHVTVIICCDWLVDTVVWVSECCKCNYYVIPVHRVSTINCVYLKLVALLRIELRPVCPVQLHVQCIEPMYTCPLMACM